MAGTGLRPEGLVGSFMGLLVMFAMGSAAS